MENGDKIQLSNQEVEVIECKKCGHLMVNIDQDKIGVGDFWKLKLSGVRVSNPLTPDPICLKCEVETITSNRRIVNDYFERPVVHHESHHDDSDDHIFSGGGFGGFGGFGGGGGGGFIGGGGSFGGGGASAGW